MNTFEFIWCSKNDVQVLSMFDKMVFDPALVNFDYITNLYYIWNVYKDNLQSVKNHETICTLHTVLLLLFLHFPHKAALILLMANMKKVLLIFQKSTDIPLLLPGNKGSSTYIIAILTSLGGWCRSSQEKDSLGAVLWGHFVFNSLSPLVTSLRNGSISLTFIKSAVNGRTKFKLF